MELTINAGTCSACGLPWGECSCQVENDDTPYHEVFARATGQTSDDADEDDDGDFEVVDDDETPDEEEEDEPMDRHHNYVGAAGAVTNRLSDAERVPGLGCPVLNFDDCGCPDKGASVDESEPAIVFNDDNGNMLGIPVLNFAAQRRPTVGTAGADPETAPRIGLPVLTF